MIRGEAGAQVVAAGVEDVPFEVPRKPRQQHGVVRSSNLLGMLKDVCQDVLVLEDLGDGLHEEGPFFDAAKGLQVLCAEEASLNDAEVDVPPPRLLQERPSSPEPEVVADSDDARSSPPASIAVPVREKRNRTRATPSPGLRRVLSAVEASRADIALQFPPQPASCAEFARAA
eukprot:CAMPEP_0170598098 /NCGR_PEP_ID=MMETSP0224-20130122/16063_1 /TAXON_ID=285029 /ORGANISM="Togula jolla, Strain CCCM 725" /LENGTH=172 /DNA_ID=CAMNT_0010922621 /DNA_START=696 /DNA_END=1212 /DNA_ORIENTATION=+